MEAAQGEVLLGVVEESFGIGLMAGSGAELAQMEDRPLARVLQHLVFVEELCLLTQLLAQVAEDGGGLIRDLARAKSSRNFGQRLELLTDAEPVGRRGDRHAASPGDPGGGADVAGDEVLALPLGAPGIGRELAFERIDYDAELFVVDVELLASLKLAHRRQQFSEGCSPLPQHEKSLANECSTVKT